MLKIKEELIQFIWQQRLWKPVALRTVSGESLSVLRVGEWNHHAGPDFFNASIRVGSVELAGNVEIHLRSSDWLKHGHQHNGAYDNIILHVVYEHDQDIQQHLDQRVEVLELKNVLEAEVLERYQNLMVSRRPLPCESMLKNISDAKIIHWIERMAIERLEQKISRIDDWLQHYQGDYVAVFYTLLLRNFGFHVNALPFEMLARELPYQLLLKHADHVEQLHALLLGTAGFLEEQYELSQVKVWQNEFEYLKHKYQLQSLRKDLLKFGRLRPANFPDRRLSQFALLLHQQPRLLNEAATLRSYEQWMAILCVEQNGFWSGRFSLTGGENMGKFAFGKNSAENILVNSIAPFYFYYGRKHHKPQLEEAALELLGRCASEQNQKTKLFQTKQALFKHAGDSQGVIHLVDNYCSRKQCLHCALAASLLKSA